MAITKKRLLDPKLNPYEQDLEDNLDVKKALRGKKKAELVTELETAAKNHRLKKTKEKRISIRVFSSDLVRLKEIAEDEGLPYQTLVTSVLHKFAIGRLVSKERDKQHAH